MSRHRSSPSLEEPLAEGEQPLALGPTTSSALSLELSRPLELIALSTKERTIRCRLLDGDRRLTLRPITMRYVVPGELLSVRPRKQWIYVGLTYVSGEIERTRLDVSLLGLQPLKLEARGVWDPRNQYGGQSGEPADSQLQVLMASGPRPWWEFEGVMPVDTLSAPEEDPLFRALELKERGDVERARRLLSRVLEADLRCLEAHAHLGDMAFEQLPEAALRHYEVAVRIAEMSLGQGFDGVLSWGLVGNRPFLRCMHGYGLCLWRLGRFEEAQLTLERLLWMNPSDNQGVRFLLHEVRAHKPWTR